MKRKKYSPKIFYPYLDLDFSPFRRAGGRVAKPADLTKIKRWCTVIVGGVSKIIPPSKKLIRRTPTRLRVFCISISAFWSDLERFWRLFIKRLKNYCQKTKKAAVGRLRGLDNKLRVRSPLMVISVGWLVPLVIFLFLLLLGRVEARPEPANPLLVDIPSAETLPQTTLQKVKKLQFRAFIKPPCGTGTYVAGQCTYGVASWTCVPKGMGHAKYWDDYARKHGYVVDKSPQRGEVAVNNYGYYGHVGLVLDAKGDKFLLKEMNYAGSWSVRSSWQPIGEWVFIRF